MTDATNGLTRLYMYTQGCQMNFLDSEIVLGELLNDGYRVVDDPAQADVALLNTCSVRADVENKVFSRLGVLRGLKEQRPEMIIGLLGCMAQKERRALLQRLPHVDVVCGTAQLSRVPELLRDAARTRVRSAAVDLGDTPQPLRNPGSRPDAHRAFVSVMRGCNLSCTYCVVPRTRGPEISRPPGEIVEEVRRLVDDGVREVTLLGQTINSYGVAGDHGVDFADLLERVAATPGLSRLRFVTSHPRYVGDRMIAALRDIPQVCEYLHFPFQAGSDRVLHAMKRRYSMGEYLDIVERLRAEVPGIALATDIIVGFPGETTEDFQETLRVMERVRFQTAFVFKYSPRERTSAARLADDVPLPEKKMRNAAALSLQERIQAELNHEAVGRTFEVLVEGPSKRDGRKWTGRTRTNRIVVFEPPECRAGSLIQVQVESSTPLTLFGHVLSGARPAAGGGAREAAPLAPLPANP